jgi:hypothetical protein
MLAPYKGRNDLITLLKADSFHTDFETLDLSTKELPSVFNSTRLGTRKHKIPPEKTTRVLFGPFHLSRWLRFHRKYQCFTAMI